ncbi:hypothetical protein AXY43_03970 [Clostridium sp. MF28]|uniref:HD domain-containing protein n=1 Tax=Clostridium sp. MF28 TaxID=1702238 RepID=UPI000CF853B4|nr:ATP-binding protein [Clostridium sp. MF28]AVK47244.1 hypothetical protein AXY43_03970 [Clostridium sp. MF28]
MTLEEHLKKSSFENEDNKELYEIWIELKREITRTLENVSVYFPHFSLHNATHSKTICTQIERLLGEERIEKLSISDTWMLLMSFYCHDLGMALQHEQVYNYFKSPKYKEELINISINDKGELKNIAKRLLNFEGKYSEDKEKAYDSSIEIYNDIIIIIQNHFRSGHANRSAAFIKDKLVKNTQFERSIGIRFVEVLSEICKLHQEDSRNIKRLPYKTNGIVNDYMHPRFIASMLCLGDLLDLDTDRYNEYLLETVTPLSKGSALHLKKHKSIKHFLVEEDGIEIISDTNDIKVYRIMREWVKWIDEIIEFVSMEWSELVPKNFGMAPRIKRKDLLINGSKKWVEFSELKFTIKTNRAIELLQGANIYKDKFACLREIVQNSIDATLIQFWKENHYESSDVFNNDMKPYDDKLKKILDYKIDGKIYINEKNEAVIEIRDYGTGINNNDLLCFKEIGNKINHRKKEIIKTMPEWLKPSGAFGLGLQSIFLITNSFEIITKADNELPKKIILENGSDGDGYIIVEDYNKYFKRGTKIIIKIDSDKIDINDLGCSNYHYKTIPKAELIIPVLEGKFDNIRRERAAPAFRARNQINDYIPVEIVSEKENGKREKIMEYKSIFNEYFLDLKEGSFGDTYGNIKFEFYDEETMSICKISILEPRIKNENFGEDDYSFNKYCQSVFFKNKFVTTEVIGHKYRGEYDVYKFIDFSINILGKDAEKTLTINRNSIKESYRREFNRLVNICVKNTLKKLIDKLLDNNSETEEIKCVIIKIYMIANHYSYRVKDVENKYGNILKEFKFNNYFNINEEEKIYNFNELKENNIYFIIEKLESDTIQEFNNEIIKLDAFENYCVTLKNKNYEKHILAHRIDEILLGEIKGNYYICAKSKAFHITKRQNHFKKNELIILYDLILAIIFNHRCMQSNYEYKCIATPSINKSDENVIELPFSDQIRTDLREFLNRKKVIDKDELLKSVFTDSPYKTNLKFISEYNNNLTLEEIDKNYNKFIVKIIEMLLEDKYSQYVNFIFNHITREANNSNTILVYIINFMKINI